MRLKIIALFIGLAIGYTSAAQNTVTTKVIEGSVMTSNKTAYDNLKAAPNFSTFTLLVDAAGLQPILNGTTPFTLFLPANNILEKLPAGMLDTLRKTEYQLQLRSYTNGYIIQGKITSADIARQIKSGNGQAIFNTLSGTRLIAVIDTNRNIVLTDDKGNRTLISRYDIQTSNAVMHTITMPLPQEVATAN